jgi:hypothetical protein
MEWLGKFFGTTIGRTVGGLLALVVLGALYLELRDYYAPAAVAAMRQTTFICSETSKVFSRELVKGDTIPVLSPYSGHNTGYPAEYCFWNADGTTKSTPTPVLLNFWIGKPGPTFCPDCGRLVVAHNPSPTPGMKPPPTRDEYERMHASSGQ